MLQSACPIRLIALDLDGTLLNDRKELTPRTIRALTAAGQRGVWIVPATGRTATGIPAELLTLPGVRYAITANGARMIDLETGTALRELYIPRPLALEAYDRLMHYDCVVDLFQDGQGYTTAENLARVEGFVPENLRMYVRGTRETLADMRAFVAAQSRGLEKYTIFFREEAERRPGAGGGLQPAAEHGAERRRREQGRGPVGPGPGAGAARRGPDGLRRRRKRHCHAPGGRPGCGHGKRLPGGARRRRSHHP